MREAHHPDNREADHESHGVVVPAWNNFGPPPEQICPVSRVLQPTRPTR